MRRVCLGLLLAVAAVCGAIRPERECRIRIRTVREISFEEPAPVGLPSSPDEPCAASAASDSPAQDWDDRIRALMNTHTITEQEFPEIEARLKLARELEVHSAEEELKAIWEELESMPSMTSVRRLKAETMTLLYALPGQAADRLFESMPAMFLTDATFEDVLAFLARKCLGVHFLWEGVPVDFEPREVQLPALPLWSLLDQIADLYGVVWSLGEGRAIRFSMPR